MEGRWEIGQGETGRGGLVLASARWLRLRFPRPGGRQGTYAGEVEQEGLCRSSSAEPRRGGATRPGDGVVHGAAGGRETKGWIRRRTPRCKAAGAGGQGRAREGGCAGAPAPGPRSLRAPRPGEARTHYTLRRLRKHAHTQARIRARTRNRFGSSYSGQRGVMLAGEACTRCWKTHCSYFRALSAPCLLL